MKTPRVLLLALSASLFAFPVYSAAQTATPSMGWNSWNYYGLILKQAPTAADIEAQALAMNQSGMQAAGYTYVNIDDEWQAASRDSQGNIQPNPKNFPDGMAVVAEYVHNLGLKIGIYSSPGKTTCSGHVGSYGHVQQDANTFASWGMDYLKYDWCTATGNKPTVFKQMATALHNTGRTFVYSIVDYGSQEPWHWAFSSGADMWRTGPDVKDDFYTMAETGFGNDGLGIFAGPTKGWNDADMLQVGNACDGCVAGLGKQSSVRNDGVGSRAGRERVGAGEQIPREQVGLIFAGGAFGAFGWRIRQYPCSD